MCFFLLRVHIIISAKSKSRIEGSEVFNSLENGQWRKARGAGDSLMYVRYGLNKNVILITS